MSMNLQEKAWPQIEKYLTSKKSILVPVGSTEQHGPTGLIGIDYLSAWKIAEEVGNRTQTLVAPPLCFGMAVHHLAFPGTISLSPLVYVQVITEIIQSLTRHGFEKLYFVNGHGGNIAPLTTAFCQAKMDREEFAISLFNWWHLPEVTAYEKIHFGEENGFHATCGEISLTMHTHPQAYAQISHQKFSATPNRPHWPMAPEEYRKHFTDGRMGSNPELCNAEHGKVLFEIAVDSISQKLS